MNIFNPTIHYTLVIKKNIIRYQEKHNSLHFHYQEKHDSLYQQINHKNLLYPIITKNTFDFNIYNETSHFIASSYYILVHLLSLLVSW